MYNDCPRSNRTPEKRRCHADSIYLVANHMGRYIKGDAVRFQSFDLAYSVGDIIIRVGYAKEIHNIAQAGTVGEEPGGLVRCWGRIG
jgi:hypothetical protein